jgi:hypothetical protein
MVAVLFVLSYPDYLTTISHSHYAINAKPLGLVFTVDQTKLMPMIYIRPSDTPLSTTCTWKAKSFAQSIFDLCRSHF